MSSVLRLMTLSSVLCCELRMMCQAVHVEFARSREANLSLLALKCTPFQYQALLSATSQALNLDGSAKTN
jgi:hypothetical protein